MSSAPTDTPREIREYDYCHGCKMPLIPTMAFYKAEIYCLGCGGTWGMFEAFSAPATPALHKQYAALKAEWDEHVAGKLLIPRSYKRDCEKCGMGTGGKLEPHPEHATPDEVEADRIARQWLEDRRTPKRKARR